MKFGIILPFGDARVAADIAADAEQAGWDGFFVWEPVWGFDAWVSLTAAAMQTTRIRLGTFLSPISRMRPWKLASETMTLDHLSGGRVILAVGMGAVDTGFDAFGEETDLRTRAALVDEGLDILQGLWQGKSLDYAGAHYQLRPTEFNVPPPTVQRPGIPVWCVGLWPSMKSMRRILRCDGLIPERVADGSGGWRLPEPADLAPMLDYLAQNRARSTPLDVIHSGETPGDEPQKARAMLRPWRDAGVTWWLEARWEIPRDDGGLQLFRDRVRQGPPAL